MIGKYMMIIAFLVCLVVEACLFVLGVALARWDESKAQDRFAGMLAVAGIDKEDNSAVKAFLVAFANPDRFLNRVADFMGLLAAGFKLVNGLVCLILFLVCCYNWLFNGFSDPALFWFLSGWAIACSLATALYWGLCKLITNRYPGQPRKVRKSMRDDFLWNLIK